MTTSIILLLYASVAFSADSTTVYTLEYSITLALENNLQARAAHYTSKSAAVDVRQSRVSLLPSLQISSDHTYSQGRSIDPATNLYVERTNTYGGQSVRASATLFNGLANLLGIRERAAALNAARSEEQRVRDELTLDVMVAYIQVLVSGDILLQIQRQLALTEAQVRRTALLHAEGIISPGDHYDLEGQLAGDQNRLADARKAYDDTRIRLCRLLNIPFEKRMILKPLDAWLMETGSSGHPERLYQQASRKLGVLHAAEWRRQQSVYAVRVAKAAYFPSIFLSAGLNTNYSGSLPMPYLQQAQHNLGRYVSIGVQIPVLSALTVRNRVAQARIAAEQAAYTASVRRHELQLAVKQLLLDMETAEQKYVTLQRQVKAYTESYRIATVRFEAGDIQSVEFLIAKNKMDAAATDLVIAQYQWLLQQRIAGYYTDGAYR